MLIKNSEFRNICFRHVKPQPDAPKVKTADPLVKEQPKMVKVVKTVKQVENPVMIEEETVSFKKMFCC